MSAASLERLKEIFHSARELPPSARDDFLRDACGGDESLRQDVAALLAADNAADDFIASPPAELAAEVFGESQPCSDKGRVIGQYRLLECVGSGGMGTVYLAERADRQFQMQVAIKLIKRGMDTDSVLRRFAHERQILASLEHPNIARLLDGGTTDEGLPYFVMEYIQGERIDRYAEEHQLSISERLELFRQVCGAVSYAHQHLVVHRDLKPSNILVTADGVPKLLDFGIAKIIQPADGAGTFATMTASPIMTPEYASPEQIEGAPATTLSDVYSLGAVLYELLAGCPPYRLQNRSPQEVAKISTAQIEKPSAVTRRSEDARRLRGDVDNIVRMAMRKESARRYRSVEQFSEDIRRHLAGRPVIARPDTLSYRSAKFVRRNKAAVAAALLILLTLLGGIVATSWQARRATVQEQRARAEQARAERRFNDVRKLANRVLFDYHDAIKTLPGATRVRELLVRDALDYLDSLAAEAHGDPVLQRELAAAYERVGDVRGAPAGGGTLGDIPGALESYRKAFAIREALLSAHPNDPQARRDVAISHHKIGHRLLTTAEAGIGVEHLRKALTLYLDLTREQPGNDDFQFELVDTRIRLAGAIDDDGDFAGVLEQLRPALETCEKLVASHPNEQRYRFKLSVIYWAIANALWMQGDAAGALPAHDKAVALIEALVAEDPLNADYRRSLLVHYQTSGDYRRDGDKAAALEYFRRAATIAEGLRTADPANARTHRDVAYTHKRIADFLVESEDYSQALPHFHQALEGYKKVVTDAPTDLVSRFLVATCHGGVARMQARLGQVDAALAECGKANAVLGNITAKPSGHLGHAQALEYLGFAYFAIATAPGASAGEATERMSTAREMFRRTEDILNELRRQRGDLGTNENWAREIAAEIAKCDTALANTARRD